MGKLLLWTLMTAEALNWRGREPQKSNNVHIVIFISLRPPRSAVGVLEVWFGPHKSVAPVGSCSARPLLHLGKVVWELNGRGGSPNLTLTLTRLLTATARRHTKEMGGEFVLTESMDEGAFIATHSASPFHYNTGIMKLNFTRLHGYLYISNILIALLTFNFRKCPCTGYKWLSSNKANNVVSVWFAPFGGVQYNQHVLLLDGHGPLKMGWV